MNRQELKARAKEQIQGKIGILFLITLIVGAVAFAASLLAGFIPFAGYAVTIIVTPRAFPQPCSRIPDGHSRLEARRKGFLLGL